MALLALSAVAAFMNVVLDVAAEALRWRADAPFHRTRVASAAGQPLVLAVEHELRPLVVIEIPGLPTARVVALLAGRTERLLVRVVFGVTGHTLNLRALEQRARVAHLAVDLHVFAQKREAPQAMVELWRGLPRLLVVALGACLAFLTLVLVVLPVAREAVLRRFLVIGRLVAGGALGLLVLS